MNDEQNNQIIIKTHCDNVIIIPENETVIKVNRKCSLCGALIDMYDKFTEEEHCQNCGWF